MATAQIQEAALSSQVIRIEEQGKLPKLRVETPYSTAEVYFQGAHVTAFQKKGEAPLLFLSKESQFIPGKAIRGGIPLIFPWFGNREGHPAHGVARTAEWKLEDARINVDETVTLRFSLPAGLSPLRVEYAITVGETLELEFSVENPTTEIHRVEACLHTYFNIGDIARTSVTGLEGVSFIDQLDGNRIKSEFSPELRISEEIDRIYTDVPALLEIHDEARHRKIRLETENSHSAVVWNPWISKSRRLADFGDEEYREMLCVETGNVAGNGWELAPGKSLGMKACLETLPFD
ncbi:MAG: D-hexose-6-phosphate mutarotase [Luteolibacter sp.]